MHVGEGVLRSLKVAPSWLFVPHELAPDIHYLNCNVATEIQQMHVLPVWFLDDILNSYLTLKV